MDIPFVKRVENAAFYRGDLPVLRLFIDEALGRVAAGKENVHKNWRGLPRVDDIYYLAIRLEAAAAIKT